MALWWLRRSAVLQMKDRNMAYHHLIGFTEFYVDGRDVQMGTVDMSQQGRCNSCLLVMIMKDENESHMLCVCCEQLS